MDQTGLLGRLVHMVRSPLNCQPYSMSDWDQIDQITFSLELLAVLRQIRDELQKIGDRLAERGSKEEL